MKRQNAPDKTAEPELFLEFTDALYLTFGVRMSDYCLGQNAIDPSIRQAPPSETFPAVRMTTATLEQASFLWRSHLLRPDTSTQPMLAPEVAPPLAEDTTERRGHSGKLEYGQAAAVGTHDKAGTAANTSLSQEGGVRQQAPKRKMTPGHNEMRDVEGQAVDNVKDLVKWVCCNSRKLVFSATYVLGKNPGATSEQFGTVSNFLSSVGLAMENAKGKGGGKGSFTLLRPETQEQLQHMLTTFGVWFGVGEDLMRTYSDKLKEADVSSGCTKEVFDLVMAAVNTHGEYRAGKKQKT